jgi:hypothetical protein
MPYKSKEDAKNWRDSNRDKVNKCQQRYVSRNKEKIKRDTIRRAYDITLEDYNEMFSKQGGCCSICKQHQTNFKRQLFIDHCHVTGRVRGLLCQHCNFILGQSKDNIDILQEAIKYLERN